MPRITSAKTYAEFKHGRGADPQPHIAQFVFNDTLTGGTFRLRVNGEETADITFSDTEADLITAVDAALDALAGLDAGELAMTGSDLVDMTLTSNVNKFYRIESVSDAEALTGATTNDAHLTINTTQIGGDWIALSADMSEFSYEETSETTDVTGLSQLETEMLVVKSNASFNLSLYEANQDWSPQIYSGIEGRLRVFNEGKVVGKKYLEMEVLLETVSGTTPDHDVLEKELSGMRQGAWIAPPDSYWKGS